MPESFDELLASCSTSALKLELRDQYMTGDPGYVAWQAGRPDLAVEAYAEWTRTARRAVERGVSMRRVRIVSEPASDYIIFEHGVTAAVNVAAGEAVRWLPRRHASDLALPGNDVWVFDGRVAQFCLFAGDGRFVGNEITDDPEVVGRCRSAFDAAWNRGVDHAAFQVAG